MALTDEQEKELKANHDKAIKEANDKFAAEKAEWEKKSKEKPNHEDDPTLADKARKEREEKKKARSTNGLWRPR